MNDRFQSGDAVICVFGLCTVLAAITWRDNKVFAYRVQLQDGTQRIVSTANTRKPEHFADVSAWARAKVRALVGNKVSV